MRPVAASEFDLDLTLNCGQVFHWRSRRGGVRGVIGETPVYVEQRGDSLFVPAGAEEALVRRYFALDHPLREVYASFPTTPR